MLRKIQEQCAESAGENGEEAFNKEFIRNLNVVLAIKKVDSTADRVVQFVSTFILCTCEKGTALIQVIYAQYILIYGSAGLNVLTSSLLFNRQKARGREQRRGG